MAESAVTRWSPLISRASARRIAFAAGTGSSTIFFAGCNLRCVIARTDFEVSWHAQGLKAPPERLAAMMLELREVGCHNIN